MSRFDSGKDKQPDEKGSGAGWTCGGEDTTPRRSPTAITRSRSNTTLGSKIGANADVKAESFTYAKECVNGGAKQPTSEEAVENSNIERKKNDTSSSGDRVPELKADANIRSQFASTVTSLQDLVPEAAQDQKVHGTSRNDENTRRLNRISANLERCGRQYMDVLEVLQVRLSRSCEELIDATDVMLRQINNYVNSAATVGINDHVNTLQSILACIREEIAVVIGRRLEYSPSELMKIKTLCGRLAEIETKVLNNTFSDLIRLSSTLESPSASALFNSIDQKTFRLQGMDDTKETEGIQGHGIGDVGRTNQREETCPMIRSLRNLAKFKDLYSPDRTRRKDT